MLVMTYIKNNWSIRVVQNLSSYKFHTHKPSNLAHFQVLDFIIYVFLHTEKQTLKSEKLAPRVPKETLVDYDSHTIY